MITIEETPYLYEDSQVGILTTLGSWVAELRKDGALTPEVLHTIRKYFRIKNIYHSNAIEGNLLNVGETRKVVEMGLTITGKPLKDQAEAKNLAEAIDFLEELVKDQDVPVTLADIRQIHYLVLKGLNDVNAGSFGQFQSGYLDRNLPRLARSQLGRKWMSSGNGCLGQACPKTTSPLRRAFFGQRWHTHGLSISIPSSTAMVAWRAF